MLDHLPGRLGLELVRVLLGTHIHPSDCRNARLRDVYETQGDSIEVATR